MGLRKTPLALGVIAAAVLASGIAYTVVTAESPAQTTASDTGVNLSDFAAASSSAVFLEADLSGRGEATRSGKWSGQMAGSAVEVLRITRNQIMYEITLNGLSAPTSMRLQEGAAGLSAGPVQMTMSNVAMPASVTAIAGVVNFTNAKVLALLISNPGLFNANFTTSAFPNGAMRGQFRRVGPVDFNRILHVGSLVSVDSGDQEVSAGDANAHATVFVGPASATTLAYAAIWTGITSPTALNLNVGAIGMNGGLVSTLFAAPRGLNPTIVAIAGTAKVTAAAIALMKANPAAFHTNILTGRFAAGAARGQLFSLMATTTTTTTTKPTTTTTTVKPTTTMAPTSTMAPTNPVAPTATVTPSTVVGNHW